MQQAKPRYLTQAAKRLLKTYDYGCEFLIRRSKHFGLLEHTAARLRQFLFGWEEEGGKMSALRYALA